MTNIVQFPKSFVVEQPAIQENIEIPEEDPHERFKRKRIMWLRIIYGTWATIAFAFGFVAFGSVLLGLCLLSRVMVNYTQGRVPID